MAEHQIVVEWMKKADEDFEFASMAEMANDPAIREVCSVLSQEFTEAENDGL